MNDKDFFVPISPTDLPVYKFALREDLKEDKRFLPTRAEPKATGWDVRAAFPDKQPLIVRPFEYVKIPLGVRGFCPDSWWYEMKPRSSTFAKKNLHALYGTIDETYEGELVFAAQYIPQFNFNSMSQIDELALCSYFNSNKLEVNFGDAIGQMIPIRRQEMVLQELTNEELEIEYKARASVRGAGGFGSTGK